MKVKVWSKSNLFGIQLDDEIPQVMNREQLRDKLKKALLMDSDAVLSVMLTTEIFGSYSFDLFETYDKAS